MKRRILLLVSAVLVLGLTFGMTYRQKASATVLGTNFLVSSDSSGNEENAQSVPSLSAISGDGRYVVFGSDATNLVPGDTNGQRDVFVKDTQTGAISRISLTSTGTQITGSSSAVAISYSGRYAVFSSQAGGIVSGVSAGNYHLYRRDLTTGVTDLVDATATGQAADASSDGGGISADGRFVGFSTQADNIVGYTHPHQAVVKDMNTGTITIVSETSTGTLANQDVTAPSLSCDGDVATFTTRATNLATTYSGNTDAYVSRLTPSGEELNDITPTTGNAQSAKVSCDGNEVIFGNTSANAINEYSLPGGTTTLVAQSVSAGSVGGASVSGGGRYVAFSSTATNLDASYTYSGSSVGRIYIKDMKTGVTELADLTASGAAPTSSANTTSISADGTSVTYYYDTPGTGNPSDVLVTGVTTGTVNPQWDIYTSKTGL